MGDFETARTPARPIAEVGEELGLRADELSPQGRWKAKVSLSALGRLQNRPPGRYILVTAICSGIQLMPGLPKRPAGERIDLDPRTGQIVGLA